MGSTKATLNKFKVCLVSALPPFRSGISLYTCGLLSGFERAKPSFSLVVMTNRSADYIERKPRDQKLLKVWTKGPRYIFQVFTSIIKERPNVVHIQHEFFLYGGMISSAIFPVLLLLLRLSGLKVVVTMHGVVPRKLVNAQFAEAFFIPERFVALNLGLTFMTILMCKLANIVIVHNGFAKDTLYKDYEVSLQKILVIPHGIGVSDPENLNFSLEKCNSVLFFGNITPSKGLETLIAAFERVRVPNVKLIIAGGPHPRGMNYFLRIAKMVRSSPVAKKIALTGYISDERIHFLFSQCSMAVFPYIFSVSSSGGLSFALQHLKPTVVTALPVFTETIIHQQNGLVVPASDSEALAEAIELLLLNDDVRHRLSRGIAENSSNLDWSVVATRTYEAYLHAFLNS